MSSSPFKYSVCVKDVLMIFYGHIKIKKIFEVPDLGCLMLLSIVSITILF